MLWFGQFLGQIILVILLGQFIPNHPFKQVITSTNWSFGNSLKQFEETFG